MFPLFETICIKNGNICKGNLHQKRYEKSYYEYYKKLPENDILSYVNIPDNFQKGLVKARVLYNENIVSAHYSFYTIQKIQTLKLVEDNQIDYGLKYSNRECLNRLYEMRKEYDDVLIVRNNKITDTSFCNIVFFDGEEWFTPDKPLLQGVARQYLLNEGIIKSKRIMKKDLSNFTDFKLINAMRDFYVVESNSIDNIEEV